VLRSRRKVHPFYRPGGPTLRGKKTAWKVGEGGAYRGGPQWMMLYCVKGSLAGPRGALQWLGVSKLRFKKNGLCGNLVSESIPWAPLRPVAADAPASRRPKHWQGAEVNLECVIVKNIDLLS